jgi:hypothetical protein
MSGGEGRQGRQADSQAHRHRGRHLPDGSRRPRNSRTASTDLCADRTDMKNIHNTLGDNFMKVPEDIARRHRFRHRRLSRRWPTRKTRAPSASRCRPSPRRAGSTTATTWSRCSRSAATAPTCSTPTTTSPTSWRRSRTWSPRASKVLVIAAIDGTTLSERAAEGGRQGRQGHRLRPPDQGLEERRLLRHLRQLPGRRAAGHFHRRQAGPEAGQGPVQHRAVRRLARTTTTPSSSTTARCRC